MFGTRQLLGRALLALSVAACGAGASEAPRRPQAPRAAPAPEPPTERPVAVAPVEQPPEPAAKPADREPPAKRERRARASRSIERPEPAEPREPEILPDSVVDRVFFAHNEASIGGAVDSLDAFARLAMGNDEVTLVLVARADGSEKDPDSLSSRRALAVRSYLVRSGVPEDRIRTHVLGVRQPRTDAGAPAGDGAANRCVELATE